MIELQRSEVWFDDLTHTYLLGDKRLSGITSILSRYLFPHKYDGIPASVLKKAADRGSLIHSLIGKYTTDHVVDIEVLDEDVKADVKSYIDWVGSADVLMTRSEFIVSDNENFASAIDLVGEDKDGNLCLGDIKTTYRCDIEYLRWQLSIYAYLLWLQTGKKAARLYGIHVRGGKTTVTQLTPVKQDHVIALLDAARNNAESFDNPETAERSSSLDSTLLSNLCDLEENIALLKAQVKELESQRDGLSATLLAKMQELDCREYENGSAKFSIRAGYSRETVDSTKLKTDYPDIWEQCKKVSTTKESLTIKLL